MGRVPSSGAPASRDRILRAAEEEFAEAGYDGARIESIARRAGVNKAMLYYRVGDKRTLYSEVLTSAQKEAKRNLQRAMDEAPDAGSRLRMAVTSIVGFAFANPLLPSIILREVAGGGRSLPPEALGGLQAVLGVVRAIIGSGLASGDFRKVDPALAQFLVAGSVMFLAASVPVRRRLAAAGTDAGPIEPAELSEQLFELLLHGIAAERKAARK
jgi:TetR/AcrR family transcriptional regulator